MIHKEVFAKKIKECHTCLPEDCLKVKKAKQLQKRPNLNK